MIAASILCLKNYTAKIWYIIQLDGLHTTRISSDTLLNTLSALMTINVKSFIYHLTSSATIDYHKVISSLSLSLNKLRYAIGHAAKESMIKSTEALAGSQENRRRMGPLNETIFRQCLGETDVRGWVESCRVTSLNDLVLFTGRGIKASVVDQNHAKERIVFRLVKNFKSFPAIEDQKAKWSEVLMLSLYTT